MHPCKIFKVSMNLLHGCKAFLESNVTCNPFLTFLGTHLLHSRIRKRTINHLRAPFYIACSPFELIAIPELLEINGEFAAL